MFLCPWTCSCCNRSNFSPFTQRQTATHDWIFAPNRCEFSQNNASEKLLIFRLRARPWKWNKNKNDVKQTVTAQRNIITRCCFVAAHLRRNQIGIPKRWMKPVENGRTNVEAFFVIVSMRYFLFSCWLHFNFCSGKIARILLVRLEVHTGWIYVLWMCSLIMTMLLLDNLLTTANCQPTNKSNNQRQNILAIYRRFSVLFSTSFF